MYSCAVIGGSILDAACHAPVRADLGINHSHGQRLSMSQRPDGKIFDIGDLGTTTGKVVIDAGGSLVLPGNFGWIEGWTPGAPLEPSRIDGLLARGVTTAAIAVNPDEQDICEAAASQLELPINWILVPRSDELGPRAAATTYLEFAREIFDSYCRLGLGASRGKIRREYYADLAMFDADAGFDAAQPAKRVVVAGEKVWADGRRTGKNAGRFLKFCGEHRSC
jgi:cytosine/adenosine deaminase-related metal-dependent hydrolase